MPNSKRHAKHAKLMDRMAQRQGVDLDLMVQSGILTPQEVRDSVDACVGCTHPGDCEAWLNAQPTETISAPFICRIADLFEKLRRLTP